MQTLTARFGRPKELVAGNSCVSPQLQRVSFRTRRVVASFHTEVCYGAEAAEMLRYFCLYWVLHAVQVLIIARET